jgi:large subunit ribosomal protein L1
MPKNGKHYQDVAALVDEKRSYSAEEAVDLAKQTARAKFDETIELHLRTGADTRHAEQLVRGVVVLPHGIGKQVRVLVFTDGEGAEGAREAGADYIGSDDLMKSIEGGWLDFDVAIASPAMMGKIGRLGKTLGRRGLMPNPRTGTVVAPGDFARTVEEAKLGRVEYRMDRNGIIHVSLGKASFPKEHLMANLTALVDAVMRARPSAVKGQFLRSAFLSTTMGPGIGLDVNAIGAMRVTV